MIFRKSKSVFDTVRVAQDEPRRYGKNGELLIHYQETDEHRRRSSVAKGQLPPGQPEMYEDVEKSSS